MVGAVRFELTTSCTRNKRASQATLRPDTGLRKVPGTGAFCKEIMLPRIMLPTGDYAQQPIRDDEKNSEVWPKIGKQSRGTVEGKKLVQPRRGLLDVL